MIEYNGVIKVHGLIYAVHKKGAYVDVMNTYKSSPEDREIKKVIAKIPVDEFLDKVGSGRFQIVEHPVNLIGATLSYSTVLNSVFNNWEYDDKEVI